MEAARHLPLADQIVVVEGGILTQIGDFQMLKNCEGYVRDLLVQQLDRHLQSENSIVQRSIEGSPAMKIQPSHLKDTSPTKIPIAKNKGVQVVGSRDKSTYSFFFRPIGVLRLAVLLTAVIFLAFSTRFQRIWVEWWTEAFPSLQSRYIGVYFLLAVGACLSFAFFFW